MNTNVFLFLEKRGRNRFPPPKTKTKSTKSEKTANRVPAIGEQKKVNKQTYVIIQASIKIFVRKTMITAINVKNMSEEQIVTKNIKTKNQTKKNNKKNAQTNIKPGVLEENLCK